MAREGNNPKRRIAARDRLAPEEREGLAARLVYGGSGYHKRFPTVYGFGPHSGRRPWKSICDGKRVVAKEEAEQLMRAGVLKGMLSEPMGHGGFPQYVWSVDNDGEAYEAKTDAQRPGPYHGYRLEEDDPMREVVLKTWEERCRQA
jgi:hypothetical protein